MASSQSLAHSLSLEAPFCPWCDKTEQEFGSELTCVWRPDPPSMHTLTLGKSLNLALPPSWPLYKEGGQRTRQRCRWENKGNGVHAELLAQVLVTAGARECVSSSRPVSRVA